MRRESEAYMRLRKNVRLPDDMMIRVENVIGAGTPDVYACLDGVMLWIVR